MAAPNNPSTHEARKAKKAKSQRAAEQAGTLEEVRLKLWRCIGRVEEILEDEHADATVTLKAAHCLSQTASVYVRLTEAGELEKRLDALEESLRGRSNGQHHGANSLYA